MAAVLCVTLSAFTPLSMIALWINTSSLRSSLGSRTFAHGWHIISAQYTFEERTRQELVMELTTFHNGLSSQHLCCRTCKLVARNDLELKSELDCDHLANWTSKHDVDFRISQFLCKLKRPIIVEFNFFF